MKIVLAEGMSSPAPMISILLYGDPIVLDAGAGFSTYHWSTGVQTQTITIYGTTAGVGAHMYVVTVSNSYGCKSSDSIVITVVDNTGIGTSEDNSYYNIYPNPTSDELYIDFKEICNDCEIIITNAQGQTLDYNYLVLTNNQRVIDFRGHAKGVYILTLKLNETIYKHKILYY
ncbi:MAG: T9SS type A sorting domain-containing protein [Bacteroidales bacterium]|nr:T9SS type A sorting domain-containing protein [Bacteroidales bacterium]